MTRYFKKSKKNESKIKVRELIKILRSVEKLYQKPLGKNRELITFLNELTYVLDSYKDLSGEEFLNTLKNSLSSIEIYKESRTDIEIQFDIENMSHDELIKLLSQDILNKEQLLHLGQKRFGLSKGTLKKLKKDKIQELIKSAMRNIETLEAIERRAVR